ncbi:MAG: mandelate racemase/muconate lactonizing enzyme family protein [Candidatus Poribacteria bacterium]|nr:mandelate racemase/muconate lactonizing enzyme family protein [Candidatus Poribacteria bacterium]
MRIKEIRAIEIELNPQPKTSPRPSTQDKKLVMNRPIDRYPRSGTDSDWKRPACIITAEDGTWGFGISLFGSPVVSLINTVYAPRLIGENCMAIEKLWDMMVRLSTPFGASGLASYAVSAVDCALWDLKCKILQRPVYELLGGPQKEKIFCYASGFDQEWYMELGFKATKLFCPYGPEHGMEGLRKLEEMVANTRQQIGDNIELMLDAWTAFDVEFTVRLAEVLKPYKLKWIEDYISSEDLVGYQAVRQRIPWQTLASGEHWYLPTVFASAASRRLVDIFQPDVLWCGGITSAMKICHIAQANGITVITHAGMNYPYGQHLAFAMPSITWGERSEGVSLPGIPLEEMVKLPGTAVIQDGYLVPSDAPGFGLEIDQEWIEHVSR